jgi:hypothetical protein
MNQQKDGLGLFVLFGMLWSWLSHYEALSDAAPLIAIALMLLARFAIGLGVQVPIRLGGGAWALLSHMALWIVAYFWLVPIEFRARVLLLWSVALPTMLASAFVRRALIKLKLEDTVDGHAWQCGAVLVAVAVPATCWWTGVSVEESVVYGAGLSVFCAMALLFGWDLAGELPRKQTDARFGNEESRRHRETSDER